MTIEQKYNVFAYKQSGHGNAPLLLSFVVPAERLLEWAGIPRRADDRLVGFQRPDNPVRVKSAKEFFNTGQNQSPTSLIVGFHQGASLIELKLDGKEDDPIRQGVLTISCDCESITLEQVVQRVRQQLQARLVKSIGDAMDEADDDAMDEADEDAMDEADDGAMDEADEDAMDEADEDTMDEVVNADREVELGKSIINELLAKLDDTDWVKSNESHLRDIAKPATLIDGQHRLLGAAQCEREIPFQVCAIYDCPWEEQVFQFTIVNYKQQGIPDQFITANAALSLTRGELNELQDRLVQAKVKVVEYELMKIVEFDPLSPFYKLVNLTEKKTVHLIGYKTMLRIANGWYQAKAPFFQLLLASLYPDIKGKSEKSRRQERWKDEDWGKFFLDFWTLVKAHYGSHHSHVAGKKLWDVGYSQLIVAIVLLEFQNVFFESLTAQEEEFFEVKVKSDDPLDFLREKLKKKATKHFNSFPEALFQKLWGTNSLNIGPGRDALNECFSSMNKNKGRYKWEQSTLVKGTKRP
ncbi:MAG: hypothetical protein WCJ06_17065 [Planctomycetota bacterium]